MRTGTQKRAVIYLRTSSIGQVDREGPKVQEDACRAYAEDCGMQVVAVLHEAATSGRDDQRPKLAEALAMVAEREAEVVLLPSMDRLARDATLGGMLMGKMWEAGAEVHSAVNGIQDPDDPMNKFYRTVMLAVAELERDMIVQRLRRARDKKREEGGKAEGQYPFGHHKDPATAERERNVLRCIENMHAQGVGVSAIARHLNNLGPDWYTRTGKQWSRQAVYALVNRAA